MKFVVFLTCFLAAYSYAGGVSITAHYREAADIFDIMDCTSGWWEHTFCADERAYQIEWEKRFGEFSKEDKTFFTQYDQIRRKYFRGLGMPTEDTGPYTDGVFAKRKSITEDLIAPAFYGSNDLDEAISKLNKTLGTADLEFLKKFYDHFRPRYTQLLDESKAFIKKAKALNQKLGNKRYGDCYEKILKYYSVTEKINYEVLYTWWPPIKKDYATPTDKFLVLRQNPIKHFNWDDEDVVFHEIVHTISVRQPQKQKEEISKTLLEKCPIEGKIQTGKILEEPMAVVFGQIMFLETFKPKQLTWESKLYNNPWISSFAKLIYPVIKAEFQTAKNFSVKTAEKVGFLCNELLQTSDLLHEPK
jgi:hypothetical protein